MSKKIFCSIPDVCLDQQQPVAAQVRSQLRAALEAGIEPTSVPRGVVSQAVFLDEPELTAVLELSQKRGVVPGKIVGGLMYAQHLGGRLTHEAQNDPNVTTEPVLEGLRTGQIRVLQQAAPLLRDGKVVFSECGTGTGKARLIAHAAAFLLDARDQGTAPGLPDVVGMLKGIDAALPDYLQEHIRAAVQVRTERLSKLDAPPPACVVACAPSIENVSHLVAEWIAVRPAVDPNGLRRVAVRLGRGQFVSQAALEALLDEAAAEGGHGYPSIRRWMAQMPAGKTRATRALLAIEPGLRGLMADLMAVATEDFQAGAPILDLKACALHNDSGAAGEEGDDQADDDVACYREHMQRYAEGFDLLFTTTALVCLDNLQLTSFTRANLLPVNILGLLVDEGHQLESIQANIAARGLSLSRLVADLKRLKSVTSGDHARKALEKVQHLRTWMSDFPDEAMLPPGQSDPGRQRSWEACKGLMREIAKDLESLKASRSKKGLDTAGTKSLRAVIAARSVLSYACGIGESSPRGIVSQSPVRGFISMTFGPPTVVRHLMARWAQTPCAMLFSGTLFHMSASGSSARAAAADVGAISRFAQTDALHPSWLFKPVELIQPSLENFHRFMPPKRDESTDAALRGWLEAVSQVICKAAKDSVGGMLVLMTGYQRLDILRALIAEALPESERGRLIAQAPHTGVGVVAEQFIALSRSGTRPICIATGAAWTGLDLSDREVAPANDFLLTDIVIPAAPFGLERSTTHSERRRRMGFVAELMGVQQRLRQGFGRLVRREGVQSRRIWLLDGRLIHPATATRFADIRRATKPYLHRGTLE